MRDPLFFIAILPGEEIQREVTGFKQECARRFKASHSLKSPPHLTLIPPFPWPQSKLGELGKALKDFTLNKTQFDIELKNFSSFPPRVIFVDVVENQPLKDLQLALFHHLKKTIGLEDERGNRFHPHMTIAHRDLKSRVYPDAWAYFSKMEYQRTFQADGISLLEHLKGRWEVREHYFFD